MHHILAGRRWAAGAAILSAAQWSQPNEHQPDLVTALPEGLEAQRDGNRRWVMVLSSRMCSPARNLKIFTASLRGPTCPLALRAERIVFV